MTRNTRRQQTSFFRAMKRDPDLFARHHIRSAVDPEETMLFYFQFFRGLANLVTCDLIRDDLTVRNRLAL